MPFVLLLLDFWPLRRIDRGVWKLIREKMPLFLLAITSAIITLSVQEYKGAVQSIDSIPLGLRLQNVVVSYIAYLLRAIWPVALAPLYPFPSFIPIWQVAGAFMVLSLMSLAIARAARPRPYLAFGWCWYLGTLVPVIGLIQVGLQASADRYTYLPLIGVFIMVAWGLPDIIARWPYRRTILAASASLVIGVCTIATRLQVTYWTNSLTMWQHTVDVTRDNSIAHNNLGYDLAKVGRLDEAVAQYTDALRISPDYVSARANLALVLNLQRKFGEAIPQYERVLRADPNNASARNNLGVALANQGRLAEATNQFTEALRINPDFSAARTNLDGLRSAAR
jgi:hypothetical protein